MASKIPTNVKTPRELHLEADGFTLVPFACDEEVHAAVFGRNPNVKLTAKSTINVIADQKLSVVDREERLHPGASPRDISSAIS
jgi:hypothetical protein